MRVYYKNYTLIVQTNNKTLRIILLGMQVLSVCTLGPITTPWGSLMYASHGCNARACLSLVTQITLRVARVRTDQFHEGILREL